ncbi:tyrosine-type recombinase/integrase [Tepidibacter aestuarii]|uniref:tyrosine-type recombinase/integrase n=1 Tax=Tepidibacter aestuarii TaxID=2925782 RepID=UPI0020C0BA42|nr:tyrosine-type recombinase/integrase [Tepidibacter aestuarii]CAH2213654.1 Site-specific recombinase XerD [Tepidibacter aestuarii]CAH2215660.1 Site-specific recombinase XerD [Tepidibacter aestuarii]
MEGLSEYEHELFKEFSRKLKPLSRSDYLNKIILFKSTLSDKNLLNININESKQFIEYINSIYAKSTCEKIYSYLHSFYNFLVKENYIQNNPFANISKPYVSRIKNKNDVLSLDELNKLISIFPNLNKRDRAIISFLISTGCLLNELINLKWKDLTSNTQNNCSCKIGNQKKERIVELPSYSWDLIMDYKESIQITSIDDFVFKSRNSNTITDRNVRLIVKNALSMAGLSNYSAKDFRHSFATFSLKSGLKDENVKEKLGWSDKNYATRYKYVMNFVDSDDIDYIIDDDELNIYKSKNNK